MLSRSQIIEIVNGGGVVRWRDGIIRTLAQVPTQEELDASVVSEDSTNTGGFAAVSSTVIQVDESSKQDILAIPVGKVFVPTDIICHSASEDISTLADGVDYGTDAGGGNLGNLPSLTEGLTTSSRVTRSICNDAASDDALVIPSIAGPATLGVSVLDNSIAATFTLDLFGYFIDA